MKKIIIIMMLILLIFTGCRSRAEPRILLDTDSLTITREGGRIAIYSHTDGKEYNFSYYPKARDRNALRGLYGG